MVLTVQLPCRRVHLHDSWLQEERDRELTLGLGVNEYNGKGIECIVIRRRFTAVFEGDMEKTISCRYQEFRSNCIEIKLLE